MEKRIKISFDYNKIAKSVNEKDVENSYRELLLKLFPECSITSPFKTDGILENMATNFKVLLEFKYNLKFSNKLDQIQALIQSVYYLKKIDKIGGILPSVVFIGDIDECFAIHINPLTKYMDYKLDWNIAPSDAYKYNKELVMDMLKDENINPYVFKLDNEFVWNAIRNKIIETDEKIVRLIKITEENLHSIYSDFCKDVIKDNTIQINDLANIFISVITNPNGNYLHAKKKNTLVIYDCIINNSTIQNREIKVDERQFQNFFEHYDGSQYSYKEKKELTAVIDRLIEDETRRRKGEFFTPTNWVKEAHDMISEQFGSNWKEKIVWDCASGTMNLTRDNQFKELYSSTIEESDLRTAEQMGYNKNSVKFQYDFLNDGIIDGKIDVLNDSKLPQGLKDAFLQGKEIIIFINPPYGTANVAGAKGEQKAGMALTKINELMKSDDWGASSQQLYTQFLYRITKLKEQYNCNVKIAIFHKSIHFSGSSYKKFRELFFKQFNYVDGMLFQASHFDDVSSQWGIDFALYEPGECVDKINFIHKIKDLDKDKNIVCFGNKNIYNLDNAISFSDWIKRNIKKEKTFDAPQLSSALIVKDKDGLGKMAKNSMGYFFNIGNNVMKNSQEVYPLTSAASSGHGISILKINFLDVISNFVSRKLISGNYATWINDKDEYIAPTEDVLNSDLYKQYNNDAIVYSLFNTSSNQSALRQIDYKDKKWDIKNEFFWLSKEEMSDLADKYRFDELYKDAEFSNERYVYDLLKTTTLSPDAQELLNLSKELIKKSFEMRVILHEQHPEWCLNAWDAGWYQIKLVLKEYFKEDYKIFTDKYKAFENRMRPLVYELGFLK